VAPFQGVTGAVMVKRTGGQLQPTFGGVATGAIGPQCAGVGILMAAGAVLEFQTGVLSDLITFLGRGLWLVALGAIHFGVFAGQLETGLGMIK